MTIHFQFQFKATIGPQYYDLNEIQNGIPFVLGEKMLRNTKKNIQPKFLYGCTWTHRKCMINHLKLTVILSSDGCNGR